MELEARNKAGNGVGVIATDEGVLYTQPRGAGYLAAVLRGNVYCVGDSAGGANPSGLSASPISVCLHNPVNSGVNAIIWFASVTSAVAPAAIQHVWLGVNNNPLAAAVTGTALASKNCLIGRTENSKVRALTTATLPAAPVVALVLGATGTGAITTQMVVPMIGGWLDGAIVLGPNSSVSFQFSSISGTAANMASWIWEEVAI